MIYGPYNTKGELWSCIDVDACNGFWLADGSYGYASTTKFPYTVGCFGPAPNLTYGVATSCSTNACVFSSVGTKLAVDLSQVLNGFRNNMMAKSLLTISMIPTLIIFAALF